MASGGRFNTFLSFVVFCIIFPLLFDTEVDGLLCVYEVCLETHQFNAPNFTALIINTQIDEMNLKTELERRHSKYKDREHQRGLIREKSPVDAILTLKQIIEKTHEQEIEIFYF